MKKPIRSLCLFGESDLFEVYFEGEYKGLQMVVTNGGASCQAMGGNLSLPSEEFQRLKEAPVEVIQEALYIFYNKFMNNFSYAI